MRLGQQGIIGAAGQGHGATAGQHGLIVGQQGAGHGAAGQHDEHDDDGQQGAAQPHIPE